VKLPESVVLLIASEAEMCIAAAKKSTWRISRALLAVAESAYNAGLDAGRAEHLRDQLRAALDPKKRRN